MSTPSATVAKSSPAAATPSHVTGTWKDAIIPLGGFALVIGTAYGLHQLLGSWDHTRANDDDIKRKLTNYDTPSLSHVVFGRDARKLFHLRANATLLNHGSYGAAPRMVTDRQRQVMDRVERHPDAWFRYDNYAMYRQAVAVVAKFAGAPADDCVFVQNATTGVNSILYSLIPEFKTGDVLLTASTTYNAVKLALRRTAERSGASYKEFSLTFPATHDSVVENLRSSLDANPTVKLVVLDHITSATALILPIKRLVDLCKSRNIQVLVDGAHAIGHIPLDIASIGADYYTTNLHKWAYGPKGSALLYIAPQHQSKIHPVVTSHNSYDTSFVKRFYMQGTRDESAYIAAPAGIAFLNALGCERVQAHNRSLARWAADMIGDKWGTSSAALCDASMNGNIICIKLPAFFQPQPVSGESKETAVPIYEQGNRLMKRLYDEYDIMVAVMANEDQLYVRISAQIYNTKDEYERLATVITTLATPPPAASKA